MWNIIVPQSTCSKVDMETEGRLRGLLSDLKGIELQTEGVRGASVDVWAARRWSRIIRQAGRHTHTGREGQNRALYCWLCMNVYNMRALQRWTQHIVAHPLVVSLSVINSSPSIISCTTWAKIKTPPWCLLERLISGSVYHPDLCLCFLISLVSSD